MEEFATQQRGNGKVGQLTSQTFLAALLNWHLNSYLHEVEALESQLDRLDEDILREPSEREFLNELVRCRRRTGELRRLLTATAAPPVREEIVARLGMREPRVLVRGFDRPNIHLAVQQFADEGSKRAALLDTVVGAQKPGIVYAATRKGAEAFAHDLVGRGVRAAAYHAGMNTAAREDVQSAFMADRLEVIVATTAFGMGIDKPNVRFVHHLDLSGSIDAYYQEIGRAGRDGEPASAILFFTPADLRLRRFFVGGTGVDADQVSGGAGVARGVEMRRAG